MQSFLLAQCDEVWLVCTKKLRENATADERKYNNRARNWILESLSEEVWARVHSKATAYDVWALRKFMRSKMRSFVKSSINSRLNVLSEQINSLGVTPLTGADLIRKILMSLPMPKFAIVKSLIYKGELSTQTVADIVGEIRSHEMFILGLMGPTATKDDLALKVKGDHKSKKKSKPKPPPSSSSDSEHSSHEESNDDEDEEKDDHGRLCVEHDALIEKYDEVIALNKLLESSHEKLKLEHSDLKMRHQELEFAYDSIDPSVQVVAKDVGKVNASTSCEDLLEVPNSTVPCESIALSPKANHDRQFELEEEVQNLTTSMNRLVRGEYLHREMLFHNARNYGSRGLG
ncbi:unnamed protein product [Urochloa decumbens]|uniref:Uncharacterized protein n=1 Tax=Urochloa decumbens TaxID=240449 RepID=A0ABC9B482_9POAL